MHLPISPARIPGQASKPLPHSLTIQPRREYQTLNEFDGKFWTYRSRGNSPKLRCILNKSSCWIGRLLLTLYRSKWLYILFFYFTLWCRTWTACATASLLYSTKLQILWQWRHHDLVLVFLFTFSFWAINMCIFLDFDQKLSTLIFMALLIDAWYATASTISRSL